MGKRDPRILKKSCWRGANIWMSVRKAKRVKKEEQKKEPVDVKVLKISELSNSFKELEDEWKEAEDGQEGVLQKKPWGIETARRSKKSRKWLDRRILGWRMWKRYKRV